MISLNFSGEISFLLMIGGTEDQVIVQIEATAEVGVVVQLTMEEVLEGALDMIQPGLAILKGEELMMLRATGGGTLPI